MYTEQCKSKIAEIAQGGNWRRPGSGGLRAGADLGGEGGEKGKEREFVGGKKGAKNRGEIGFVGVRGKRGKVRGKEEVVEG